jgi:16S rRNA (uracil1498-N3)-methyltransferase
VPVVTRRTIVDRLNLARLRAHAVEAAEQCERTALPVLEEPRKLDAVLKSWPADRTLWFADEAGGEAFAPAPGPAAIRALKQARPVSLGPRILRADTAAIAAISLWMAKAGDWNRAVAR